MEAFTSFVESFINIFSVAASYFCDLLVGICPMVLMMLVVFNAIISFVGQDTIDKVSMFLSKYSILAYTVLPIFSMIMLGNPMNCTPARFLKQKQRVGFWEASMPLSVPLLHWFPHTNPAEYYLWWGIASGVDALGHNVTTLAIRLFCYEIIIALIRSYLSEYIWCYLAKKDGRTDLIEA